MTQTTSLPDLSTVNRMDCNAFVNAFGSTFEHAPWVAQRAWAEGPFATVEVLHASMMNVVNRATRQMQVSFLCGHPELAGKEAEAGTMTSESEGEQASAGLDSLNRDEIGKLRELNQRYRKRHGFPFIIAVRRYSKPEIFEKLACRSELDSDVELLEALQQIAWITRKRIDAKLSS
ncbi:MAG: 2-oxo-4-hydroxy-4-carboxy-5-ureidoimidazoline decarboxylase [Proteobacteria bacterium]|nr:MAG: 2-oxo-4-hydroxy-4-carboxy-5-ureidoimidazoline decarboxylase [Pseudomonadota bacterium]